MADYYDILGVSKNATDKEVRQAFRRLARQYHPDLNSGDKKAEATFKQVNEAYEVLSDPENRSKYDRHGQRWKHADQIEAQYGQGAGDLFGRHHRRGGQGEHFGYDIFGGLGDVLHGFGGRGSTATAPRVEATVTVTLDEAFTGAKRRVTVSSDIKERRIEVTIPPGVDTGSVVHVALEQGNGLFLNVSVSPHPRFQRKGNDLYLELDVPFLEAILGGEREVQTLRGKVQLKIPAESQNGQKIRLTGQGMPNLGSPQTSGDLYVTLRPTLPKGLAEEERELLRTLQQLRTERG